MRKLTFILAVLLFAGFSASAQQTITGKVTNAESGEPIPGVSIVVKSQTTIGTTSDMDGNYSIGAPSDAETLVFSFVGMQTKEVPINGRTTIDVAMQPQVKEMEEVVVTALGISRERKSLGYSVQDVGEDQVAKSAQTNVMNSLSGKVAGLSVSSSSGSFGGSSKILLRGVHSIDKNNNPLFVVDGVPIDNSNFNNINTARGAGGVDWGNAAMDISPSDIKSISVLKGASATALYGSRGANGVIMIETKSGEAQEGIGVTYNSEVTFSEVGKLPEYQNKYGGGAGPFLTTSVDGDGDGEKETYQHVMFSMDQSWGPRFEGQEVVQWNNVYDWEQGITENLQTRPWEANPGNIRNFFETGVGYKNNIAFSGGNKTNNFRLSYTNNTRTGVYPNSEMQKNNISFSGMSKLSDNLQVNAKVNYISYHNKAKPYTGYSDYSHMQKFTQWGQRQYDFGLMENYENPDGTQRTWNRVSFNNPNPKYADNPYFVQNEAYPEQWRERIYGNVGINYQITEGLEAVAKVKKDYYVDTRERRIPEGSVNLSYFTRGLREVGETNYTFRLNYDTDLTQDIGMSGLIGANRRDRNFELNSAETQGGLSVPGIYAIDNSVSPPSTNDYKSELRVNSLYGRLGFDYRSMVFLDMTLRNDWSSTLPQGSNSYMYPSVTGSVILSEMEPFANLDWLSFAKVRGSWAQVGSDTDPYQTSITYATYDSFTGMPRTSIPWTLNNMDLKPEITTSYEGGFNVRFFNNRLGLDVTYYNEKTTNGILTLPVPPESGYGQKIVNAGEMRNNGWEVMMDVTPIKTQNFTWNVSFNWSKNNNEVVDLASGITNYQLTSGPFNVTVSAKEGEEYGVIRGSDFIYQDGKKVVNSAGMYAGTQERKVLGSYLPDWTGGMTNTFSYKGLSLDFTIDVRKGGALFSTTNMWGMYSGMLEGTAENHVREYGMVLEGVKANGEPNDIPISAGYYGLNHYYVDAMNIIQTDYFKLRDFSLSYTLPQNLVKGLPVQQLSLGITGRNLFMWGTDSKHFDPEHTTTSGNIQGIEGGGPPPTRAYGLKVNVKF